MRNVDSLSLGFSLSSHRQSYIDLVFTSLLSINNKQQVGAYMEELSDSFNVQDQGPDDSQAPDDTHVQDCQCVPRNFVDLRKGNFARFLTK